MYNCYKTNTFSVLWKSSLYHTVVCVVSRISNRRQEDRPHGPLCPKVKQLKATSLNKSSTMFPCKHKSSKLSNAFFCSFSFMLWQTFTNTNYSLKDKLMTNKELTLKSLEGDMGLPGWFISKLIIEEQSEWGSSLSEAVGKLHSVETLLWSKGLGRQETGTEGGGEEDVMFLPLLMAVFPHSSSFILKGLFPSNSLDEHVWAAGVCWAQNVRQQNWNICCCLFCMSWRPFV